MMNKIGTKSAAGLLAIVMAFILVGIVLLRGNLAAGTDARQELTLSPEEAEISRLQGQLEGEGLSAEGRRSLEEKLQMAERMEAEQNQPPQARSTKIAPPLPQSAQLVEEVTPLVEGIFEGSEGIIRPSLADINNLWQGVYSGKEYQVFAGKFSEERGGGGVVIVIEIMPDLPSGEMHSYPAPEGAGSLRIIAIEENIVVLENEAGDRLMFDLESRSFEN